MADFPAYQKNSQVATQEVVVTAPTIDPNASAQERYIQQQWRDVAASDLGAQHPLSINRDSEHVTTDPYDVP